MWTRMVIRLSLPLLLLATAVISNVNNNEITACNLPQSLITEIASYQSTVDKIIHETTLGASKGFTYSELANFVDEFGNRIAGSTNLENAIDYMLNASEFHDLENVHGEKVEVPHWVRGEESAAMLQPRHKPLAILGLGGSVGTPAEGITAEAFIVRSFDELESAAAKVKGKIVVFNEDYVSYGETVKYRDYAAVKAAQHGAVATLVRSVTPFSLYNPHTGWQDYSDNVTKIPTACITIEDARLLQRIQAKGKRIVIQLKMDARTFPNTISRNTVVEIIGSTKNESAVIVSGHLDSWDVGEGAMDDGAGAFISWASLVVLKRLGLRPKRTIRAVLWTAEEEGLVGAIAYAKAHKHEINNLNFVMESDEGTFTPLGLEYSGGKMGGCILEEVLKLLQAINATQLKRSESVGSDITVWTAYGMPGASLYNKNERYFWYHHSNADTMDVEDSDTLDLNTALWAAVAYVIADLGVDFPRNDTFVS